jgi:hypothetical protein
MSDQQHVAHSLLEQIFFSAAMSWLAGNPVPLKIDGTAKQVNAVKEVFEASRAFINELHNDNATPESVMNSLQKKYDAAEKFKVEFGINWLL